MESRNRACGCRYIRPDGTEPWYQVVACPDHRFDFRPLEEVPE